MCVYGWCGTNSEQQPTGVQPLRVENMLMFALAASFPRLLVYLPLHWRCSNSETILAVSFTTGLRCVWRCRWRPKVWTRSCLYYEPGP